MDEQEEMPVDCNFLMIANLQAFQAMTGPEPDPSPIPMLSMLRYGPDGWALRHTRPHHHAHPHGLTLTSQQVDDYRHAMLPVAE